MAQDDFQPLSDQIEMTILTFISSVRSRTESEEISTRAAAWLMLEHYQFSMRNPSLLMRGAKMVETLRDQRATCVLMENYHEEKDHSQIYRRGLLEHRVYVEERVPFPATDQFLDSLMTLIESSPAHALGALYATESAALLEHQIFNELSRKLSSERHIQYESSVLAGFHGLHLAGVEEAHARELRAFLQQRHSELVPELLFDGARKAVESMNVWWKAMFARIQTM